MPTHGLMLFEDTAQAHGATLHGARGRLFRHLHAALLSFYPTKNMTSGGGGMVTSLFWRHPRREARPQPGHGDALRQRNWASTTA